MTREELKAHCIRQIEQCEMWAKLKGEEPSGKVYEEHKLILELLEQEPCEDWCDVPSDEMTLGQARQAVKDLRKKLAEYLWQEPVLNKIRAEIWDLQYGDEEKSMTDEDRADAYNNAIRQVIEIIDKYKAKSEDKE